MLRRLSRLLTGRSAPAPAPERRDWSGFMVPMQGPVSSVRVNAALAENLSTVSACVQAIASGLASLPAYVYRRDGAGRTEAPDHPVARLIARPNPRQTWPDFLEWLIASTLLHGNGLAAIETDRRTGQPVALTPIPWTAVQAVVLPSGALAFNVAAHATPWGGTGLPRRYLGSEVLHLKDRSDDGWLGRSRISRSPAVLAAASGLQTYSAAVWDNAAMPSGAVELAPGISPDGVRRLEAWFAENHTGAANGGRPLFLDPGSKWHALAMSPEDSEVLASRRFTGEELARLFNVPPPLIGDLTHGSFQNSETAGRWFAQFTLAPWARKIEAECARALFVDDGAHLEIDLSGLMRGDYAARWTANVAAVQASILTADEVREQEGFNPRPAGTAPALAGSAAA